MMAHQVLLDKMEHSLVVVELLVVGAHRELLGQVLLELLERLVHRELLV